MPRPTKVEKSLQELLNKLHEFTLSVASIGFGFPNVGNEAKTAQAALEDLAKAVRAAGAKKPGAGKVAETEATT